MFPNHYDRDKLDEVELHNKLRHYIVNEVISLQTNKGMVLVRFFLVFEFLFPEKDRSLIISAGVYNLKIGVFFPKFLECLNVWCLCDDRLPSAKRDIVLWPRRAHDLLAHRSQKNSVNAPYVLMIDP